jgi:hypothetical protein
VQEIYGALLGDASREASRPSPGKVTRTMRLQAQRAGKHHRPQVSRRTGQPIAPGKRTLTWYLEPAVTEQRASEESLEPSKAQRVASAATLPWFAGSVAAESRHAATIARQHVADEVGDPDHPMVHEALRQRGAGAPLPEGVRREMEARLGVDLARVRVHVDQVAEQATLAVRARAFTVGEDIFFAAGAFAPGTAAGAALLAHELTHVVQARQGRIPSASGVEVSRPGDALEREAEATSRGVTPAAAPGALADVPPRHGVVLHRTPEQAQALIDRHTSLGNLDEAALGRALLRLVRSGQLTLADEVLTALGSTDRDDVAYEFMRAIGDPALAELAAQPSGRHFLDRIFDELTAGSVAPEEQQEADRVLQANARSTVSVDAFDRAATARGTKIFPFRLPGFTVLNDAPIEARRERGGVWCHSFVRVLGTDEFRAETQTLPTEYFINGIILPEDEVIGVRLYDQGGIIHHTTPLFLIQLANATNQQVLEKILEAAGIGLTLGAGALAGLGIEASLAARVLLWADRAAFVLGTLTSVLREHRSWLAETFGSGFMDAVDTIHSACAIYGMARVAYEAPRIILALRNTYRAFREASRARSSGLSSTEQATVQSVTQSTDELLQQVDEIQGARPGTPQGGQPRAVEPATSGGTPEPGVQPQAGPQPHPPEPTAGPERAGGTSEVARDPRQELISVLGQRQQQIQGARGDLNLFRAAFRRLTSDGNTPRRIADIAPQLEQLLTQFRRARGVTGGGRAGNGVSTYVESLDGQFSIRITHNQVGATPVGNPPMPRIHVYQGAVSGHGSHVVLEAGTTLDDILRALGVSP